MYRQANLLYRVVDALFRSRTLFLVTVLLIAIPITALLLVKSKGYYAAAAIRIDQQQADRVKAQAGGDIEQMGWKSPAEVQANTLITLLMDTKPDGFVDHVLQRAALPHPIALDPSAQDPRLGDFLKNLGVKAEQDNLVAISLTWPDPVECQKLVQAVQEQYVEERIQAQQQASDAAARFLSDQIQLAQNRVNEAASALRKYQEQNPNTLPEQQKAEMEHLSVMKSELGQIQIAVQESERQRQVLAGQLGSMQRLVPVASKGVEISMGESPNQNRLRGLLEQRARLVTGEGAFRPDAEPVVNLDREIAQVRREIQKDAAQRPLGNVAQEMNPAYISILNQAQTAAVAVQTRMVRMNELQRQIADAEKKLRVVPAIAREMDTRSKALETQEESLSKLREDYNSALRKANLEREQASQALKTVGQVVAENLSGTKKKIIMALVGLLIGVIVAAGMVALREWSDPTLRYESDIERLLEVPVLIGLPENPAVLAPRTEKQLGASPRRALPASRKRENA